MKKFAINCALFIAMYLGVVTIVGKIAAPAYYWGNRYYAEKITHLGPVQDSINAVFIGSSRIYRSINPKQFDSLVNEGVPVEQRIHSFNLGTPATYQAETYMLCSELIEHSAGLRYIFLEVNYQPDITGLSSVRGSYWIGWKQARFCISDLWSDPVHERRFKPSLEIIGAWTQNVLTLRYLTNDQPPADFASGKNRDGFYSLDEHYAEHSTAEGFKEHEVFLADTGLVNERAHAITATYRNFVQQQVAHEQLSMLEELQQACRQKNIQLVLLIMPRMIDNYALNVAAQWNGAYTFDYCNPTEYPELYTDSLSFDVGHLNKRGSVFFTQLLAGDFRSNFVHE